MKTENLAIVFVDIAGFTPRTSAQTREENLRMLRRFEGAVKPLVRVYKGRVVKSIGDAFLLTFRSPTDALLCSTAIHDWLAESHKQVDAVERFTIRAAVNVGEVRIEGGDVFGEAVNIASRIEGKAGAGEVYFSESVFLSMTKSEVPSEEVGYTELKGISGKVRLYRVPRPAEQLDVKGSHTVDLPFGGLGLNPVRSKLTANTPAEIAATQDFLINSVQTTTKGVAWWWTEIRRSRVVQYATATLVALLFVVIIFSLYHHKSKPATRWQKLQHTLKF